MGNPLLDRKAVTQLCFVTDDLEKSAKWFGGFLGMDVPEFITSGTLAEAETEYRGVPSEARCRMAFFNLDNVQLELIEPDGHPSCWRDFLDKNGPGMHHIAFRVDGMEDKILAFGNSGYPLLQKGEFEGGRYAYVDTEPQLGLLVELLEYDHPRT